MQGVDQTTIGFNIADQYYLVERGRLHPNTLTLQLPRQSLSVRSTGLSVPIREFVMATVSARFAQGETEVRKRDIAEHIKRSGGSVSRSGLKRALAELRDEAQGAGAGLARSAPGIYVSRSQVWVDE